MLIRNLKNKGNTLKEKEALKIIYQVILGLKILHQGHIAHRDLGAGLQEK